MTVHSALFNGSQGRPIGKGRYSYQTPASLVGMVCTAQTGSFARPLRLGSQRVRSPWSVVSGVHEPRQTRALVYNTLPPGIRLDTVDWA